MKQAAQAAQLFQRVQQQRPFEPHSYRDLARSLEESGKYGAVRASLSSKADLRSSSDYKWYALAAVMLGTFMSPLDASIANVALPTIGRAFGGRDHTTVLYACKRTTERMRTESAAFDVVHALTTRLSG